MNSQGVKLEFPIGLSLLHLSKYKSAEVSVAGRGSELLTLDAERAMLRAMHRLAMRS